MNHRITEISHWLKEQNLSFAFVNSTPNVYYLSQFYCEPHERLLGLVIFPDQEPFLICPAMETFQAKQSGWKNEIVEYRDSDNVWDKIAAAFQQRNITNADSIAVEREFISYQRGMSLLHLFPNATLSSLEQKIHRLRMNKSEQEVEILREAARYADYGVEVGVQAIGSGKTEMEILAAIEFELKKKGIKKMSFSTMVLSGEKTALPHGKPGDRKIREGDFCLI
jgi:Xaa-Pro dipeptidase